MLHATAATSAHWTTANGASGILQCAHTLFLCQENAQEICAFLNFMFEKCTRNMRIQCFMFVKYTRNMRIHHFMNAQTTTLCQPDEQNYAHSPLYECANNKHLSNECTKSMRTHLTLVSQLHKIYAHSPWRTA